MSGQAKARPLHRPRKVTPARWAAWLTLRRTFDEDAWTDRAFTAIAEQLKLDPRERAFAQLLTYGTVQQAKRLDHVIATLGKRPLAKLDPPVLNALRIGTYELLELATRRDASGDLIGSSSAHAAVDQAVELVRGVVGERAVAFTNAILRRAQVDGAGILAKLDMADPADAATLLSMPQWLVEQVRAGHGELGIEALAAQNRPSPVTALRINPRHTDADRVLEVLPPHVTLVASELVPGARLVEGSTAPLGKAIEEGLIVPQSLASQLVALALDPQPGERVLDMCAAPGGKTTQLAAMVGDAGHVLAVDLHEHRADSVRALATRTSTGEIVVVRTGDATELDPEETGLFDRVLVDAPCTGTGVLARRPDSRWKRSADDLDELVALQASLLAAAARLVRPGGIVVYSTCSILVAEDEEVVAGAPAELVPDALPAPSFDPLRLEGAPHMARTWPQRDLTDGFFIARLRRTGAEDEA